MPVSPLRPDFGPPAQSVRWTWTLTLTSDHLASLIETCLHDPNINMRVTPSYHQTHPHTVKLRVAGAPEDAIRLLNRLDADLERHHIGQ